MIGLLQRDRAPEAAIGRPESPYLIEPSHASFRESPVDVKQGIRMEAANAPLPAARPTEQTGLAGFPYPDNHAG